MRIILNKIRIAKLLQEWAIHILGNTYMHRYTYIVIAWLNIYPINSVIGCFFDRLMILTRTIETESKSHNLKMSCHIKKSRTTCLLRYKLPKSPDTNILPYVLTTTSVIFWFIGYFISNIHYYIILCSGYLVSVLRNRTSFCVNSTGRWDKQLELGRPMQKYIILI